MGIFNRIRNIWNLGGGSIGPDDIFHRFQFMEWTGDGCGDNGFHVDLDECSGIDDAYRRCSTLRTIANRIASAHNNGKWWLVDAKDNDVLDKYKGIKQLLRKPNPIQTWGEFMSQLDVYRQLYGEVFVYAVVPVGYSVQDASALWVINPGYIDIEITGKLYMQSDLDDIVLTYFLNVAGIRSELEKEHLLCIKDTNQNIRMNPSDIRGKSRLLGLENSIRNVIQAEEAVYALNKDRGAMGILTNETKDSVGNLPVTPEEKERLQKEYNSSYGLRAKQRKIIITDAALKWQQMSFNVEQLKLFEGMDFNIQRISDALDYPYELLSSGKGATYANKLEAKKLLYQDTIIPISKLYAEKFTEFFGLDRASFFVDFSDVDCLRESEAEKADMLYKQNQAMKIAFDAKVISAAEWRLAIGMDENIYKPDNDDTTNQNNEYDESGTNSTEEGK